MFVLCFTNVRRDDSLPLGSVVMHDRCLLVESYPVWFKHPYSIFFNILLVDMNIREILNSRADIDFGHPLPDFYIFLLGQDERCVKFLYLCNLFI